MEAAELLHQFHQQTRLRRQTSDQQIIRDLDGPVRRRYPRLPGSSYAMIESPEGLGADPDHWIARQVDFFAARGERAEWKTYDYDQPDDLGDRLTRAGFVAGDDEVILIGQAADLASEPVLPGGVHLRLVDPNSEADFRRIHELQTLVWDPPGTDPELTFDRSWTAGFMRGAQAAPELEFNLLFEQHPTGPVLSMARLELTPTSQFAGLWGGTTRPEWRGLGLYRAGVAYRAQLALDRGYRYLRVDTSPDSRPILTRLGMQAVAVTTPYELPLQVAAS